MNEITKELLDALKLAGSIIGHPDDSASKNIAYVIAKAEAALAEPQADADGWIPWSSGECPIATGTVVDVKYRNGAIGAGLPANIHIPSRKDDAGPVYWRDDGMQNDIIAYRIVKESDK